MFFLILIMNLLNIEECCVMNVDLRNPLTTSGKFICVWKAIIIKFIKNYKKKQFKILFTMIDSTFLM